MSPQLDLNTIWFVLVGVLLTGYDPVFTLITFGTVVVYIGFTFAITEWRMDFRHQMNRLDSEIVLGRLNEAEPAESHVLHRPHNGADVHRILGLVEYDGQAP